MIISTKFNVGTYVFTIHDRKVRKLFISTYWVDKFDNVFYFLRIGWCGNIMRTDNEIFATKQELLEHLDKTIE